MTPSTDWKEVIPEGEAARFESYAEILREMQRKRLEKWPKVRGLHGKGKAGVEGELTVLGDLPEHARQGLFAKPGVYRAYVRFSNGRGQKGKDPSPDVRGIGIKVVGVDGKKIIPGMESARTQDFLAILTPSIPIESAADFVWLVQAAASPALLPLKLFGRFGFGRGLPLLKKLVKSQSVPLPVSLATNAYFSAVPIKYGPYAVKYSVKPHAMNPAGAKHGSSPDYLGDELKGRLAKGPVIYDFRVQFFVDEQRTPIENPSVDWDEAVSPWVTVGKLTLPQQDAASPRGQKVAALIEDFSFDPWHALEAHRPLGDIMRARNAAYRLSTMERKASPEPDGTEPLDP
jgi:hypothetical protein